MPSRNLVLLVLTLLAVSSASILLVDSKPFSGSLDLAALSSTPQTATQPGSPITEYSVPTSDSGPIAITSGMSQTLWFTEFQSGKIASLSMPSGVITEIPISGETGAHPATIALDHRGNVWFTDENNASGSVWMYNPSNSSFSQFKTPDPKTIPIFALVDVQDNIWFSEINKDKIGELAQPNYALTEYALPTTGSGPAEMSIQPGTSYLWITEEYTSRIARFDMADHSLIEFIPNVSLRYPVGIVADQSGNIWVAEHGGSSIVLFQPSNSTWSKFLTSIPSNVQQGYSAPATLTLDKLGRLWFVEHFSNKVGRLLPPNLIEEFTIPTPGAYSLLDTVDANGNFWFTEFYANKIGVIQSSTSSPFTIQRKESNSLTQTGPLRAFAGIATTTRAILDTNLTGVHVALSASSSFSTTGQASEVAFNPSALTLEPGEASVDLNTVTASITPGLTLSSGRYSVSLAATYGNFTSILILPVQVTSISDTLIGYLPEILTGVAAVVALTVFLVRKRKNKAKTEKSSHGNHGSAGVTAAVLLAVFFLLSLGALPYSGIVRGKCPGLPPPPVGNNFGSGDPYTIYVDIASVALVAIVLLIVGWKVFKARGKPDSIGF